MTGSYQHSEEECAYRSKECNAVRMFSQQFLCDLYQPVHAAGSLKDSGACDCRYYYVYHIGWRCSGLHLKTQDKNRQSDAGYRSQRKGPVA